MLLIAFISSSFWFIRARIANIGGPRYMYSGFREGKGQNGETKLRLFTLGFESYMNYSS
uniref:Uncharacterized protein n=1 Tax=Helianthus annuus TaxID=4232 RepID=A0A251S4S0_HELAN